MRGGRTALTFALAAMAIGALSLLGVFRPLNEALMEARFRLIDRAPTGDIVIVGIDPYTLEQNERWPWSRAHYARAIDNLFDAGADVVAFDVDFSSRSDEAGDAALKAAIDAHPGQVVLPEFYQSYSGRRGAGAMKRTAPNPYFLDNAVIAGVNLIVEPNGVVRRGWYGSAAEGAYRGSIATVLANAPPSRRGSFLIDYSIDPHAIKRLSFSDIENGTFDPAEVAGKQVLIGATALELGDEFATPVYGLLPGVVLHALGYESLVQGRALFRVNDFVMVALAALAFAFLLRAGTVWSQQTLRAHALVFGLTFGLPALVQQLAPVSIGAAPVYIAQGAAVGWLFFAELRRRAHALIAQKLETVRQQALIALVMRDSSDGVLITDADGRIAVCNERASFLLGASEESLTGAMLVDAAPGFPSLRAVAESAADAPALVDYKVVVDGETRVLEVAGSSTFGRIKSGRGDAEPDLHFSYTLRDVTARKNLEQAERDAKEAAVAASNFKNRLISTMSHELRTPLNSIVGFAGVLADTEDPDRRKHADFIRTSGGRLLGLVNDILQISRFDSGDFTFNPDDYSLREVWDDCIAKVEALAEAENKTLAYAPEKGFPTLIVDYELMARALGHLLSNAVKFTGPGGAVTLRSRLDEDKSVVVTLEDNGVGCAEENLSRLGEAFYQGDSSLDRAHEGSGLGLHIARRCIELHKGTLSFESAPGEGFRAVIRLPASAARAARAVA
ncbi:MAG: CHASE2 domain-containing protein [Amphiplicatus sp.]